MWYFIIIQYLLIIPPGEMSLCLLYLVTKLATSLLQSRVSLVQPLPISKDFSPSKSSGSYFFFQNFPKLGSISKGFSPQKRLILQVLFLWGDPLLRIFWEKVTHLGSTSPYALICEYPQCMKVYLFHSLCQIKKKKRLASPTEFRLGLGGDQGHCEEWS